LIGNHTGDLWHDLMSGRQILFDEPSGMQKNPSPEYPTVRLEETEEREEPSTMEETPQKLKAVYLEKMTPTIAEVVASAMKKVKSFEKYSLIPSPERQIQLRDAINSHFCPLLQVRKHLAVIKVC
jgi:hypothetical protein